MRDPDPYEVMRAPTLAVVGFVVLAIHRSNKERKIKTAPKNK